MEVHREWVLNGDAKPDQSQSTYPLSHGAYSSGSSGVESSSTATATEYSCVHLTASSNMKPEVIVDEMFASNASCTNDEKQASRSTAAPSPSEQK